MAIITTFTDNQPVVQLDSNMVGVIENYVSFAATSVSAADVVEVLDVGAGTWVHQVGTRCITAESATCTATVGDASGADSWDASINLNSANTCTKSAEADAYFLAGKYYSSADTVDFTMGHDTDAAIMYVYALAHWPARMAS